MDNHKKLINRQNKILDAMNGVRSGRVPLMYCGDSFAMQYINPALNFKDMLDDYENNAIKIVNEFLPKFPEIDLITAVAFPRPRTLGAGRLAKTYLPGREMKSTDMWTLCFTEPMLESDYDYILEKGWKNFYDECRFKRLGYTHEELLEDAQIGERTAIRLHDAGYPFQKGIPMPELFDIIVYGRGMMNAFVDLYEEPEKVKEVLNLMLQETNSDMAEFIKKETEAAAELGEVTFWQVSPCVNANANMVSRETFDEFFWPLIKSQADTVIKNGGYVFFHMDVCWTPFLDYFKDFPKGKCFFDTDGGTDLDKVSETLGDRMAFTGSVAPAVMAFGKSDEVYKTVKEQKEKYGNSFVVATSCAFPTNTPRENFEAFYAAAVE